MNTRIIYVLVGVLLALAILSPVSCMAGALTGKSVGISPGHGMDWRGPGTGWVYERPQTCAPLTMEDWHNIDIAAFLYTYLAQDGAIVKAYRCLDKNAGTCMLTGEPWWHMSASYWLQNQGYPASVYASYTNDPVLGSGDDEYYDNVQARAMASNYDNTDILVGLHTNAFDGVATGTEIYYEGTQTIHQPWWTSSKNLASAISASVLDSIRTKYTDSTWVNRGVLDANGAYKETQLANRPTALLELAFHDNCGRDARYLQDHFFQSTTMWAAYKGVCDFFGVTPTYDYYSCDLISSDIPTKMIAGQTVTAHITLLNHGVLWNEAQKFRLEAVSGADPFTTQTKQIISGEVGPTQTVTFTFDLTAPTVLGPYQTSWRMTREGIAWFGPTVSQLVQVVDTSEDTTPPSVPTNFAATPESSGQMKLTWTASTDDFGVAGYKVFRNGTFIGSAKSTSYLDSGLQPNTAYTYQILAYDGAGNESAKCDPVTATTLSDATPPSAPTGVSAVGVTGSQINITWNPSWDNIGVVSYKIFRDGTLVGAVTAASFADTGLANGSAHTYQISALDSAGNESNLSAPATGRTYGIGDTVLFSDNMESYTSQASFAAVWPVMPGYTTTNWSAAQSFSPTHSAEETASGLISVHDIPSAQSQISIGTFYEFKFYDPAGATNVKHWATIRNYSGGGHSGTLQELLVAGCNYNQSGFNTTNYNARSAYGLGGTYQGWFDMGGPRKAGWHTMRIDVTGDNTNTIYPGRGLACWSVDGVRGADNVPIMWLPFTCMTIGSANASAAGTGSYYYDDVKYGVQGTVQRLSGPDVSAVTTSTAAITWKTDVSSGSLVDYGPDTNYGSSASDASTVKTHSITLTGLTPGTTYHFKVTSSASGKNASVSDDCTFTTAAASLGQLKGAADGTVCGVNGVVVSAVLTNGFYVQDINRVCGMKVLGTQSAAVGSMVNVSGVLATVGGERVLQNAIVTPLTNGAAPLPLGIINRSVGGPLTGAANTGLLVKAWGVVTDVSADAFWIDDGSAIAAADGKTGIKVAADGLTLPSVNDVVVVTGISGSESVSGTNYPVLRPRSDADVVNIAR